MICTLEITASIGVEDTTSNILGDFYQVAEAHVLASLNDVILSHHEVGSNFPLEEKTFVAWAAHLFDWLDD